jgi:hypothetical protein
LGAALPTVEEPRIFLVAVSMHALHFYDLGAIGWIVFGLLAVLALAPFVRPQVTCGVAAVPLLALSAGIAGMAIAAIVASSYGLLGGGIGAYVWMVAAMTLAAAYSRRIVSLH